MNNYSIEHLNVNTLVYCSYFRDIFKKLLFSISSVSCVRKYVAILQNFYHLRTHLSAVYIKKLPCAALDFPNFTVPVSKCLIDITMSANHTKGTR